MRLLSLAQAARQYRTYRLLSLLVSCSGCAVSGQPDTSLMDAMEARREGRTFRNQYSLGYRANAEQVFGPRTRSYLGWTLVSRAR